MRGPSYFRSKAMLSRSSRNDGPEYQLQTLESNRSCFLGIACTFMFAPVKPEIGSMSKSVFGLYPTPFKNGSIFPVHSSYLSLLHSTVGSSILLTTTISRLTPAVFANIACSRVCPPIGLANRQSYPFRNLVLVERWQTSFKLASPCTNDQHAEISLCCTVQHAWDIILVSRSVEDLSVRECAYTVYLRESVSK